ncbi:MAG: M23 family metallopeptidase [Oscillospiraceae bacterium]|nr:M23 family metallopeptidase [Oscillospiraceae bacterium]
MVIGNHIKIQNGNLVTLYAHLSSIYVSEGEYIQKGQAIGEVGATGNTTGPHLHFEIRKQGRFVDPDLVLNFN